MNAQASDTNQIFVNLPNNDLMRTMNFFGKLGFSFDPAFTDENAACPLTDENICAMLLVEKFFREFVPDKEICDVKSSAKELIALTVRSRQEVDEMSGGTIVLAAGGSAYRKAQDYGWMYSRTFLDVDGHIWEIFHTNIDAVPDAIRNKE